jgi:hypothetical protein
MPLVWLVLAAPLTGVCGGGGVSVVKVQAKATSFCLQCLHLFAKLSTLI